jgi:hypothetical protein
MLINYHHGYHQSVEALLISQLVPKGTDVLVCYLEFPLQVSLASSLDYSFGVFRDFIILSL